MYPLVEFEPNYMGKWVKSVLQRVKLYKKLLNDYEKVGKKREELLKCYF